MERVRSVRAMRWRRRKALRSERRSGRVSPPMPVSHAVLAPALPEIPRSRSASLTEIRHPRTTGMVAATSGSNAPTASCNKNDQRGMAYPVVLKLSKSAVKLAYCRPMKAAVGMATAVATSPSTSARARYMPAICHWPAPMVFMIPISRTCPINIAAMRFTTRMPLKRSARAPNAPCV